MSEQLPILIDEDAEKTVDVRLDEGRETVWLTQRQMTDAYTLGRGARGILHIVFCPRFPIPKCHDGRERCGRMPDTLQPRPIEYHAQSEPWQVIFPCRTQRRKPCKT